MIDLSIEDARSIFIGCLLEVDGEVVYVIDIATDGLQNLYHLDRGEAYFRKGDFNTYKPIHSRLGYVNHAGQAIYIYRTTNRQYKFGLHSRNINTREGLWRTNLWEVVHSDLTQLRNKSFLKTFNNEFPTLREALALLGKGAEVVAFDRQFAVNREMHIGYKDVVVGRVHDGSIIWAAGKEHLEKAISKGQV